MKDLIFILLLLLCPVFSNGQKIQILHKGHHSDSSFYHVAKIGDNEYWAGGEYGILKRIDSLGNMSSVNYPNKGVDILKIEKVDQYVYLITSNAIIYRYDIEKQTFLTKEFSTFKNRCFYDLIALPSGELMLCGGASGIAKAKKEMPHGFIATVDKDLNQIKVIWKSFRQFVWSLHHGEDGGPLTLVFNGRHSKVLSINHQNKAQKIRKIKGMAHELFVWNNQIWLCGAKNLQYKVDGLLAQITENHVVQKIQATGCIWSLVQIENRLLAVTQKSGLLSFNLDQTEPSTIVANLNGALYDIEKISESKVLVVGHGKTALMVDFGGN